MEKYRGSRLFDEGPVCVFLDREDPVWGATKIPEWILPREKSRYSPATQVDESLADRGNRGRLARVLPVLHSGSKSSFLPAERQENTYRSAGGTRGSNIPGVSLARPKPRALQN